MSALQQLILLMDSNRFVFNDVLEFLNYDQKAISEMAPLPFKWKRMKITQLPFELLSNNHCSCLWQELSINRWAKRGTLIKILINLSGTSAVVICWIEMPVRTGNNMVGYCIVIYTLVIVTFLLKYKHIDIFINTFRPEQSDNHFADHIFKCIFLRKFIIYLLIKI